MKKDYRIKEVKYDDGSTLFFAQHLEKCIFYKNKWDNIQNKSGHYKIETAIKDIKSHFSFYNPPKVIDTIIHQVN